MCIIIWQDTNAKYEWYIYITAAGYMVNHLHRTQIQNGSISNVNVPKRISLCLVMYREIGTYHQIHERGCLLYTISSKFKLLYKKCFHDFGKKFSDTFVFMPLHKIILHSLGGTYPMFFQFNKF